MPAKNIRHVCMLSHIRAHTTTTTHTHHISTDNPLRHDCVQRFFTGFTEFEQQIATVQEAASSEAPQIGRR